MCDHTLLIAYTRYADAGHELLVTVQNQDVPQYPHSLRFGTPGQNWRVQRSRYTIHNNPFICRIRMGRSSQTIRPEVSLWLTKRTGVWLTGIRIHPRNVLYPRRLVG